MAAECDVVVVGYGPTGMVTAALLGQLGIVWWCSKGTRPL